MDTMLGLALLSITNAAFVHTSCAPQLALGNPTGEKFASRTRDYIVETPSIQCAGRIIAWELKLLYAISDGFFATLWRPNGSSNYRRVGFNYIEPELIPTRQIIHVPKSEQLMAEPGDVFGLMIWGANDTFLQADFTDFDGHVILFTHEDTFDTPFVNVSSWYERFWSIALTPHLLPFELEVVPSKTSKAMLPLAEDMDLNTCAHVPFGSTSLLANMHENFTDIEIQVDGRNLQCDVTDVGADSPSFIYVATTTNADLSSNTMSHRGLQPLDSACSIKNTGSCSWQCHCSRPNLCNGVVFLLYQTNQATQWEICKIDINP